MKGFVNCFLVEDVLYYFLFIFYFIMEERLVSMRLGMFFVLLLFILIVCGMYYVVLLFGFDNMFVLFIVVYIDYLVFLNVFFF